MRPLFLICLFAIVFITIAAAQPDAVPLINNPLVPASATPGGSGFALIVNGTGFVSGAVVEWNGAPRPTTFISPSQLSAAIASSDIASSYTATVTVANPGGGVLTSNPLFLTVTTPRATILVHPSTLPAGMTSLGEATGDFNEDGNLDLAVANYASDTVSILLSNRDGTFMSHVDYGVTSPLYVAVGDFNGDGHMDLAVADNVPFVSILLGNGDGTFQPRIDYPVTGYSVGPLVTADFNKDGKLDLAVGFYFTQGGVSVLLGNGDGTFQNHNARSTSQQLRAGGLTFLQHRWSPDARS